MLSVLSSLAAPMSPLGEARARRFFPIASPRDLAAHARLLALRGAETNFRVRNCRRFHLKALDHLVLLIVFLLRR
jgi:hypothetical protein